MVHSNFRRAPPTKKSLAKPGRKESIQRLVFQDCIKPAPMVMKPFSSLINPFRHGCSIFCNHPTKNVQLKMAIEKTKRKRIDDEREAEIMGQILEDIICKYGTQSIESETAMTTPESEILPPPRPQLVLNLRRTASQETGRTSGGMQSIFSPSPSSLCGRNVKVETTSGSPGTMDEAPTESRSEAEEEEEGKSEVVKRRGKIRKKRKKTMLEIEKGEKEVIDLIEPNDTMVSTCRIDGTDYESDDFDIEKSRAVNKSASSQPTPPLMESDLFDNKTLRHLRRSLSLSDIESEFRRIWKRVLQEALGACKVLPRNEVKLDDGLKVAPCEPEKWLCYPRTYKRSDSRFDLPIDKRVLREMKPLQYLKNYVYHSKSKLLLYKHVFDKYKEDNANTVAGKVVTKALGEVMGCEFDEEDTTTFKEIVDLKEEDQICFKTWLGLCCFSERLLGEKFSVRTTTDCGERDTIEVLDFKCLEKRLPKLNLNEKILKLLKAIESS